MYTVIGWLRKPLIVMFVFFVGMHCDANVLCVTVWFPCVTSAGRRRQRTFGCLEESGRSCQRHGRCAWG